MPLARVTTFAIVGIEPNRVDVEVDLRPRGLPAFTIVGLGDQAVREARERVGVALRNAGFTFPAGRLTVNLAPAYLRKVGPGFDLAIACGVLAVSGQADASRLARFAVFGELSLSGQVRPSRGALAVAEGTLVSGLDGLILACEQAAEAALVAGIEVRGLPSLRDLTPLLAGEVVAEPPVRPDPGPAPSSAHAIDLADVRGHGTILETLTIAAAGGHNLLLSGPPGTGKTMLARRLPTILPPLSPEEALEVTRIRSVVGQRTTAGLERGRPFRAPHHAISVSGLVGGGSSPRPGEVTLAHHGVLFLDELSEFARPTLEALRQPLEDGSVTIVRGQRSAVYPSRCMLVAATNPCPCGYAGSDRCRCTDVDHARHRRRLSGPLLDRIDLHVDVKPPTAADLERPAVRTSEDERARVMAAREVQAARLRGTGLSCNAHLPPKLLAEHAVLDADGRRALRDAYRLGLLSPRGHQRLLRVARTIADLDGSDRVLHRHLERALGFRQDATELAEAV